MRVYYRISDGSGKAHLPGLTKRRCLKNFLEVFGRENVFVVADRCGPETLSLLDQEALPYDKTDLGNAGSFVRCLEAALSSTGEDVVYFVEDDYFHRHPAVSLIGDGLKVADYVTLYDHPDKYSDRYNRGEVSKVVRTPLSHWRYTVSTCGTFATSIFHLRRDAEIFFANCKGGAVQDHVIFSTLTHSGRRLAVPLPGAACHMDISDIQFDNYTWIEEWAADALLLDIIESILGADETQTGLVLHLQERYRNNRVKLLAILSALEDEIGVKADRAQRQGML